MKSHRTDRTINSIIGKAESVGVKLPNARHRLLERIHAIDGFPVGTDNDGTRGSGAIIRVTHHDDPTLTKGEVDDVPSTGVEVAMVHRLRLLEDLQALDAELNAVVQILTNLDRDCDRIIGERTAGPERCTATGREGAIEWADPNCWDAQIRGTLCAKCYQRERRWRIAHGLPTREGTAA